MHSSIKEIFEIFDGDEQRVRVDALMKELTINVVQHLNYSVYSAVAVDKDNRVIANWTEYNQGHAGGNTKVRDAAHARVVALARDFYTRQAILEKLLQHFDVTRKPSPMVRVVGDGRSAGGTSAAWAGGSAGACMGGKIPPAPPRPSD